MHRNSKGMYSVFIPIDWIVSCRHSAKNPLSGNGRTKIIGAAGLGDDTAVAVTVTVMYVVDFKLRQHMKGPDRRGAPLAGIGLSLRLQVTSQRRRAARGGSGVGPAAGPPRD